MADLINPYAAPAAPAASEAGAPAERPRELLRNPYAPPPVTALPGASPGAIIPPGTVAPGAAPVFDVTKAKAQAERLLAREQEGVDYRTGAATPELAAKLSLLTQKEQSKLLKQTYGDRLDTDVFGNWIVKPVTPGGYPVAVIPKEGWGKTRVASHAGEVAPAIGATVGSIAGAPSGPVGGMAGAGLGTAAGESVNALIAQKLGIADRTAGEQAAALAKAGVSGAVGEGVARSLMKVGRATAAPYAEFSPLPQETIETGRKAAEMGLVPRVGAANPKSFLGAREQGLIEAVFGFPAEKKNIEVLRREGQKLVGQTGGVATAPQQQIIGATEKRLGDLELNFKSAKNKATQLVDDSIRNVQQKIGKQAPLEVQRDIEAAHRQFQDEASNIYGQADKFVGNRPVVPTLPIRIAAKGILDSLPKTVDGKPLYDPDGVAIQFLNNLTHTPEMMTMQQMQALRSQLAASAEVRSLLASTGARNSEILRQAANDSFDMVGNALSKAGPSRAPAAAKAAIAKLREADAFYANGMKKFDLPIIQRMTLEARRTGSVPPEQVLDAITMPNAATNVGRIMSLVKPETQQAIRRAHFDSMMEKATDPLTGKVSGIRLAGEIKRLKSTFPALYGRDAKSIQTIANQLASLDGKLDPAMLKSGNVTAAIKKAAAAEKTMKAMTDDELFGALVKPGFESGQAVDHLFRPNSPERITRAITFFGEKSPEVKNIRAIAMGKLLSQMEVTEQTRNGAKQLLSGKALEDSLKTYGKPTLDAMFGKEQAARLQEFAKVAEMATAKNPHLSTIAAAVMTLNPVSHAKSLAELFTMGRIASSPAFIKWLTEGYRYPPPLARGTAAFTRAAAIAQAIQSEQPSVGGDTIVDKGIASARNQLAGVPIVGAGQTPGAPQP